MDELSSQISTYLNGSKDEATWMARSKDVLSYPKALYLKNKLPTSPDRRWTPKGKLGEWMKNRLKVFNPSNTHLWYTWLQCKRATLPVSEDFVESTYKKHNATLLKPDDGCDETIESIMSHPAMILACRQMSDALEQTISGDCDFTRLHPSINAAFEASRKQGGQQGELVRLAQVDTSDNIRSPVLIRMFWRPDPKSPWRGGGRLYSVYEHEGRDEWTSLLRRRSEKEVLSATIQAVLEPMKVRVISKGNALEYYMCRLFQKAMHGSLRDLKPFHLIGQPFNAQCISRLRQRAKEGWQWLSIDYSAATDNLSWKYSSRIFGDIVSNLPEETQKLLFKVLGAHDLYYPTQEGIEFRGRMQRGQLMGSVLSFPILCLANFGVYCEVSKSFTDTWSIGDIFDHVLVNGDDMLYAAPKGVFESHTVVAGKVGLDMSVGKAYEHPIYFNINSVAGHCDLARANSETRRIDFLNAGLFFGQHKVQNRETAEDHHTTSGVAACANEVLKGCFRDHDIVLKRYLCIHKEAIQAEKITTRCLNKHGFPVKKDFQRDLFLPVSLGGLGIQRPKGFISHTLRLPRIYASYLVDQAILARMTPNTQHPIIGYEPEAFIEVPATPWFIKPETIKDDVMVDLRKYQKMPKEWRMGLFEIFKDGFIPSVMNKNHLM